MLYAIGCCMQPRSHWALPLKLVLQYRLIKLNLNFKKFYKQKSLWLALTWELQDEESVACPSHLSLEGRARKGPLTRPAEVEVETSPLFEEKNTSQNTPTYTLFNVSTFD